VINRLKANGLAAPNPVMNSREDKKRNKEEIRMDTKHMLRYSLSLTGMSACANILLRDGKKDAKNSPDP